ncbi:MAG: hypothetical protein HKN21_17150, partial [Candidatus Eisenbacteria bacterium]|nr:hypothetical protein [Candidatus Eisenbacteria bacterium]
MSRRLVVVLTLFAAISFGAAFSLAELPHKKGSTVLQKIHDAKAKGESYSPELWREAKAEYESARASGLMTRDYNLQGGSDSSTATVIGSSGYVDSGNTTGLGNNALFSSCLSGGADTSEDAWYVVTFVENVDLTTWTTCADVGPPSYDTRLGVFDSSLNIVGCNDDAADCGFPNYQSKIENLVLSPGTYYIVVDGYSGSEGPYELNVNWVNLGAPCFGSDASTATQITSLPFSHTSTTVDSCDNILVACELGGSSSGADVWYQIDLTESVYLDAWTNCDPGDIDTKIALLSLGQTEITCNDDDTTCVNGQSRIEDAYLSPGSYLIVVDSPLGGEGSYTVKVDTTHAPPGLNPDLLPDIIALESSLYDNDIVTNIEPGRTHLRLSNTTANIGAGKLHLYGVDPGGSPPTQEVRQRIYRQDNSFYDQPAGYFLYHPTHGHIHVEHWSSFRLREILPGFGVGNIVAEGEKTSFCLLDLSVYDSSLPGHPPGGEFNSCGTATQGLSIGWADIYSKGLDGQWIDITDVPDGIYWLESMVDPQNNMVESDETNNTARIQVTIGTPTGGIPDRFEPNVDTATVDGRPEGGPNSPNLGPVGPIMTVDALSVHQSTNDDYFRFYMPATGGFTNEIQIDFQDANGDLQLELQNIVGTPLGSSTGSGDIEVVSLQGIGMGYYYARVYG